MAGGGRRILDVLACLGGEVLGSERPLADEQLERRHREGVAVRRLGRGLSERPLGSQIGGGPEHLTTHGQRVLTAELRDPEVGYVKTALAVEEEIGQLHVTMNHSAPVRVVERAGCLLEPGQGHDRIHDPAAQGVGRQSLRTGTP